MEEIMLPKNTPKIQLTYPKSFNCFAETRCYPIKYMQFFATYYSEHDKDRYIADAKKLHHKYIYELTFLDTGALVYSTCSDARRPASHVIASETQFANVSCVLFKVED